MAESIQIPLEASRNLQKPKTIRTDNYISTGFVYDNINTKRSKFWDMLYYWIRDHMTQGQFVIYLQRGAYNEADRFT